MGLEHLDGLVQRRHLAGQLPEGSCQIRQPCCLGFAGQQRSGIRGRPGFRSLLGLLEAFVVVPDLLQFSGEEIAFGGERNRAGAGGSQLFPGLAQLRTCLARFLSRMGSGSFPAPYPHH